MNAAITLAPQLSNDTIIIIKYTVPVGTNQKVEQLLTPFLVGKSNIHVVSNPEFLREGNAIFDFMNPDRIIIGIENNILIDPLTQLYQPFKDKIQFTNRATAEIIKYAANSFLATKVAFINELSHLCRATGGLIEDLSKALGTDHRIGPEFLKPGPGIGGSCFPKDIRGLVHSMKSHNYPTKIIEGVISANTNHINDITNYIESITDGAKDLTILGITFKANTDDIRESASLKIAQKLIEKDFNLHVYDPMYQYIDTKCIPQATWHSEIHKSLLPTDTVVILTEWPMFKDFDWSSLSTMKKSLTIIDLRHILPVDKLPSFINLHRLDGAVNCGILESSDEFI